MKRAVVFRILKDVEEEANDEKIDYIVHRNRRLACGEIKAISGRLPLANLKRASGQQIIVCSA